MAKMKTIPAVEARVHLGDIMKRVVRHREQFIVEKSGLPMVAIVHADDYLRLVEARDARFEVLNRIKARLPDVPAEEVERDVREAVRAVRSRRA